MKSIFQLNRIEKKLVTSNPFQAPTKSNAPQAKPNSVELDFFVLARKWEMYRLTFNAILAFETIVLILILRINPLNLGNILVIGVGAVVVNFFFFLGPTFDGYGQWLGARGKNLGYLIMFCGTAFSAIMALASMIEMSNL